jgi:hypothetical protein
LSRMFLDLESIEFKTWSTWETRTLFSIFFQSIAIS